MSAEFWPGLGLEGRVVEPDLLLTFQGEGGESLLLSIEAKYRSGKSSEAVSDDEPESLGDQLARQWMALKRSRLDGRPHVVYLTADFAFPAHEMEATQRELAKFDEVASLYWLSWRALPRILETAGSPMLLDLRRVLVDRYALTYFNGLASLGEAALEWEFEGGVVAAACGDRVFDWTRVRSGFPWSFESGSLASDPADRHEHWGWQYSSTLDWRFR